MREHLHSIAIDLLQQLITIPSFSKEEDKTAGLLMGFFSYHGMEAKRVGNNVWAKNKFFDASKPTLLLNSHHDTVKPNPSYTRDPYAASIENGKLFGLGSNDAGGPLVSLIMTFFNYYERPNLKYNLVMAATAEEEISGTGGIEMVWKELPAIDMAIVGEPTLMNFAVAEKGLMVLDCVTYGKAGHAAREEGVNAIYQSLKDIEWFRTYEFPKISESLGKVKMSVTVINAGQAHNQVPSECKFTVDVRATDAYSLEEILATIQHHVQCEVTPRSLRLRSSGIPKVHPLYKAGEKLG
ncbi:MAG: M20/M25/M40 family metallo-hydrolase, partial [Cyclobacteriaceae bacterium]|nr:M20/M25/M40 family metallo-hydrolase [Cyclobacteriaceae bacterium]